MFATPNPSVFRAFTMKDIDEWEESPIWDDESSKNVYSLPIREVPALLQEAQNRLIQKSERVEGIFKLGSLVCIDSKDTHRAAFKHAIDFIVPDGSPIFAAADGVVIEVVEDNKKYGDGREFRNFMNRITLGHENGEVTQYCHLKENSVSEAGVMKGDRVKQGQLIGIVGKTGYIPNDIDHLHFVVLRLDENESPFKFKSLKTLFEF